MKKHFLNQALGAFLLAMMGLLTTSASWAQTCTREYAPVCGLAPNETTPQSFANPCLLAAAEARFVSPGECPDQPQPMAGGDTDAHGCKGSAGYVWNTELHECVRPWLSQVITLEVAARRQACTGLIPMQCLMVREPSCEQPRPKWTPFFGSIVGFTHEPGTRYTLRVRKDKLDNPPADAPGTTYTLLKILHP